MVQTNPFETGQSNLRLGVAAKLRNAFIGISLLSLLATVVGLISLHIIQDAQDTVLDRSVPAMLDAQQLANEGLTIIEAVPAMIAAEDVSSLKAELARIEAAEADLGRLLKRLRQHDVDWESLASFDVVLAAILENLAFLAELIAERDSLRSRSLERAKRAQENMEEIIVALQPALIDATDRFLNKAERIDEWLSEESHNHAALRREFETLSEIDYFTVATLVETRFAARSLREKIERLLLTTEPAEIAGIRNGLDLELRRMIRSALEIQQSAVKARVAAAIREFTELVRESGNLFEQQQRLLQINERLKDVSHENREFSNALGVHVEQLQADTAALIEATRAEAKSALLLGRIMLVLIALIAFAAALVVVRRYVMRAVAQRTLRLAEITRQLARGNLDVKIDVEGEDELGEMAEAVRIFRANAKELRRSNAELEQFAHIASHDLQEPLRTISSYTELLQRRYQGKLDSKADRYLSNARGAALRMIAMVDGLLVFSRTGGMDVELEEVDSRQAVEAALANLEVAISECDAAIELDELPRVAANPAQLVNLFQNLIGNAIKYRREGVIPGITLQAVRKGRMWQFTIGDNGIGIEMQYGQQVFGIFKRLHHRTEIAGAGLGLAISKRIVESHGGRIWFDSEAEVGTQFHFTLLCASNARDDFLYRASDGVPPAEEAAELATS